MNDNAKCRVISAVEMASVSNISNLTNDRIEALAGQLDLSLGRLQSTRPELSPREREVYELIRAGVTGNRELAETLHVSVATVKTLLGRIYEKTGVSSKTHLVLSDL